MSRSDVVAIRAYLNTIEPVHLAAVINQLRFRSTSAPAWR